MADNDFLPFLARAFSTSRSASKLKPATQRSARSSEGQWTSVESPSWFTMKLRADSSPSSAGSGRATQRISATRNAVSRSPTVQAQRARPRVSVPSESSACSTVARLPLALRHSSDGRTSTSKPPRSSASNSRRNSFSLSATARSRSVASCVFAASRPACAAAASWTAAVVGPPSQSFFRVGGDVVQGRGRARGLVSSAGSGYASSEVSVLAAARRRRRRRNRTCARTMGRIKSSQW